MGRKSKAQLAKEFAMTNGKVDPVTTTGPVITPDQVQATHEAPPVEKKKVDKPKPEEKKTKDEFKTLLSQMESQFGDGCILSAEKFIDVKKMPTGILLEDILLRGGLPQSAIILKAGEESSGKTLSSLIEASALTKQGIPVLYVDAEHCFSKDWAVKLGNDLKYLFVAQPQDLEKAVDITDIAVRSRKFGMVIFDSLTAAIPKQRIEKSAYDALVALQARVNSTLAQKISSALQPENLSDPDTHNKTIVIWIAHLKQKVGIVYGNPDIIPGGKAILFHAHYILKYSKGAVLKNGDDIIGREMRVKVEKAKYSRPLVSGSTEFFFDPPRMNNAKTLIVYSMNLGFIRRTNKDGEDSESGQFYVYDNVQAKGQAEFIKILKDKPELLEKLKQSLIIGVQNAEIKPEEVDADESSTDSKETTGVSEESV
jgi:recombination protein RecA